VEGECRWLWSESEIFELMNLSPQIFTPILHWIDGKDGEAPKPEEYPYGSRGPKQIDEFTGKYGFKRSNDG